MADNKKRTIYQNLNSILNLDGFADRGSQASKNEPKKIIIRGDSPEDIKKKALEIQQRDALWKKFYKTTDHGFQKAMQYEANRLPAYLDYEGMEYYPLIASALDLFMEEATVVGSNGKMLNIYSDKPRIKEELEDLFYNRLNININLPFWTRNMCKYGDNFVYLFAEKNAGVIYAKQLVNYEMERIEKIENGKLIVKFKQRETSTEFNLLEIAHFRLLGDDKYLPYGSSILNKIRRVFRQLVMAEDAMLTYRIVRAGEKRVFKIDVGNIDEDDIESYIYKVATKFKKTSQVYPDSGHIDYRFNILGNDEDFFLPVRNGNVQTGIDTLPGAQNLDQIADIEYLRDNLFTGLGVPRTFLGYQASAGEGKNMAQSDVRFAKKINRIQQALIQELNKIAIIHLYLRGYKKENVNDFVLRLSNPSTQQDLLKTDLWTQKANLYNLLTTAPEGGIAPMSHTNAKQFVFEWSEAEIADDLKKQRMERVVGQELVDSAVVIKQSGLFTDLDKRYGTSESVPSEGAATGTTQQMVDNVLGSDPSKLGDMTELPPIEGEPMTGTVGGAPTAAPTAGGAAIPAESTHNYKPILNEKNSRKKFRKTGSPILDENEFNKFIDSRFNSKDKSVENREKDELLTEDISKKSNELRNNAFRMISEIDSLLEKSNKINSKKYPKIPSYTDPDKKNDISDSEIKELDLDDIGLDYDEN